MDILQVHKFFYPHAGAETVLFQTRELLRARGHTVVDFGTSDARNIRSPQASHFAPGRNYGDRALPPSRRARDALASVYSVAARRQLAALLNAHPVDVAHLHVIFHHLTFSVVDELHRRGIPMVMTLHDYKIGCPAYVLYRDGHRCRECVGGAVERAALHRCIKGSVAASTLAAAEARIARARGSWQRIDEYIAPSAFSAQVAVDSGIPQERVHVVPNFLPDEESSDPVRELDAAPRFLLACRLELVKGVREVLEIYGHSQGELGTLVIAGAGGELEGEVAGAARSSPWIEHRGRLTRAEVRAEIRRSRAAIVPSLWDENNPMSVLEARAAGIPVICTDVGGLPELVNDGIDGLVVQPGDRAELAGAIERLVSDAPLSAQLGTAGHRMLRARHSADAHYRDLERVYARAREHGGG